MIWLLLPEKNMCLRVLVDFYHLPPLGCVIEGAIRSYNN